MPGNCEGHTRNTVVRNRMNRLPPPARMIEMEMIEVAEAEVAGGRSDSDNSRCKRWMFASKARILRCYCAARCHRRIDLWCGNRNYRTNLAHWNCRHHILRCRSCGHRHKIDSSWMKTDRYTDSCCCRLPYPPNPAHTLRRVAIE